MPNGSPAGRDPRIDPMAGDRIGDKFLWWLRTIRVQAVIDELVAYTVGDDLLPHWVPKRVWQRWFMNAEVLHVQD